MDVVPALDHDYTQIETILATLKSKRRKDSPRNVELKLHRKFYHFLDFVRSLRDITLNAIRYNPLKKVLFYLLENAFATH